MISKVSQQKYLHRSAAKPSTPQYRTQANKNALTKSHRLLPSKHAFFCVSLAMCLHCSLQCVLQSTTLCTVCLKNIYMFGYKKPCISLNLCTLIHPICWYVRRFLEVKCNNKQSKNQYCISLHWLSCPCVVKMSTKSTVNGDIFFNSITCSFQRISGICSDSRQNLVHTIIHICKNKPCLAQVFLR